LKTRTQKDIRNALDKLKALATELNDEIDMHGFYEAAAKPLTRVAYGTAAVGIFV
jgi:hypothetical protein